MIFANQKWLDENPELATGLVTAYLKAARDLTNGGFDDPATLAIIEEYTKVPADLIRQSVKPVYSLNGKIDLNSIMTLSSSSHRDQLEYDEMSIRQRLSTCSSSTPLPRRSARPWRPRLRRHHPDPANECVEQFVRCAPFTGKQ